MCICSSVSLKYRRNSLLLFKYILFRVIGLIRRQLGGNIFIIHREGMATELRDKCLSDLEWNDEQIQYSLRRKKISLKIRGRSILHLWPAPAMLFLQYFTDTNATLISHVITVNLKWMRVHWFSNGGRGGRRRDQSAILATPLTSVRGKTYR